jgi:hypothetical protein
MRSRLVGFDLPSQGVPIWPHLSFGGEYILVCRIANGKGGIFGNHGPTMSLSHYRSKAYLGDVSTEVNQGVVGDTAKLIMHRLIARQIRRDPTLVENAKVVHARQSRQFEGWPFVKEWQDLLSLPVPELALKIVSRDDDMVRLRNSSPFYLADGLSFANDDMRFRIRRAAKRVVQRGIRSGHAAAPSPPPS